MKSTKLWFAAFVTTIVSMTPGTTYWLFAAEPPDPKEVPLRKSEPAPGPVRDTDAEKLLRKALVENAHVVFEQDIKRFQTGVGDGGLEPLYLWSYRWLVAELDMAADAEKKTAAMKAHLARMNDVAKIADAGVKAGQRRESDAAAGRYYRAQAELWVAQGRVQ